MAHELSEIGGIFEMAYLASDGTPWHGLGQPVSDADVDDLAVWGKASNMSQFTFETAPVLFYDEETDDVTAFHGNVVAFRSDTRKPIEIVSGKYKIVQPQEVLNFFDDIIRGMGYRMTSAGVLFGGRKFWAQANTGESRNIGGKDKVNASVLFATGFDGASVGMETTTRVVCNNTLKQATGDRTGQVRVAHSTTFDAKAMKEQLNLRPEAFREWCDIADAMASIKLSNDEAMEYFGDVFEVFTAEEKQAPKEEILAIAAKSQNVMVCDALFHGGGLGSELVTARGTLWGALNGVTEYCDHRRNTRTIDSRMNGAWFGSQANIKQRAWDLAMMKAA